MGDKVTLFDGQGGAWCGVLANAGRTAQVHIEDLPPPLNRSVELFLAVALLKGKALDAVIKCAVEIGAAGIIPLQTQHCEVRLDEHRAASKAAHWRTTAIEAAKQSGNLAAFSIRDPLPLSAWLAEESEETLRLVASLEADTPPLLSSLSGHPKRIEVLIGPEGDFSSAEYQAIAARRILPVSLGPFVLRAETACVYALSALHAACLRGD
ncbi:ribosomal RNA small subunit methyltransferase E [Cerasicoccus arenae]|uniref:Ribosomal RNA small subunit methyltransferase E n=1 Tax=Cerasicoccus arenae TaxID=424488 RepID=A0A8J3GCW7_9BACT|nr:ribosomal RNA small subunit methyltransferase E [Cerasicoccus arenae]